MAKYSRPLRKIGPYWRSQLQGVFCIYKPPELSYAELCKSLQKILLDDLNQLPCYPGEQYHKNAYLSRVALANLPSSSASSVKKIPIQPLMLSDDSPSSESCESCLSVSDSVTSGESKSRNDTSIVTKNLVEEDKSVLENHDLLGFDSSSNEVVTDGELSGKRYLFSSKVKDLILPPLTDRNALQHRFVCGDMFEQTDVRVIPVYDGLNYESTGVVPVCVAYRNKYSYSLRNSLEKELFVRVYHLSGTLGWTTLDNSPRAKKIRRHSYEHVGRADIDKMCGLAQNMHQWRMLNYAGVLPGSQEAYDLLKQGLVKPINSLTPPLFYGVKCIKFEPPHFTLEVHCVNETYTFLRDFVYKIGVAVRSSAFCTKVRRIRYGPIGLEHALVVEDWDVKKIGASIKECNKLLLRKKKKHSMEESNELQTAID
ncbi:pseudouridylate synthase TRUB2, mitochondrial-like [Ostrea edulis]|uniref:pseudouridylate synthase TRUB2, mitochondrial-like n=1 Tax=Ostrea edulis TaxID=37623 RepID=UPI0024AF691B|nr:pseudouridylate synthase TRUB2, mitochondrial-like [Ostrea edulis]